MRVQGEYYGNPFTGTVYHKEPNWENGSFQKSPGVHLYIELDTPINHNGLRETLMLRGWENGKTYHWGYANVIDV